MVISIGLILILGIIGMSLKNLFQPTPFQQRVLSWESFIYLLFMFFTIMLGFGLIYFLLLQNGNTIILEYGENYSGDVLDNLLTSLYLSAVTLFSLGYGDVTPIGVGRFIAVTEAMIGYTIPASYVVRTIIDFRRERG